MMQTRHSTKSTRNVDTSVDTPATLTPHLDDIDDIDDIDDLAGPVTSIYRSSPTDTATERDQTLSTFSPRGLTASHSTPPPSNRPSTSPTSITSPSGRSSANSATPIDQHLGLPLRGRDAIASFPNNINNINPSNYTWVKGSSNYTLCHGALGEPTQALLWLVGSIDCHSLGAATTYENWTVEVLLSTNTDNALDSLLKTGPWKTFTKPNRYCIIRTKATLAAVREDLRDDDDEGLASLGQTITTNDPFPYTYNGFMVVENGSMPASGYDVSNFGKQASIAVEMSILGYQMEGKEPGYSFGMRGVYHLGNAAQGTTTMPTKKRKGGCIISPRRRKTGVFNADPSWDN